MLNLYIFSNAPLHFQELHEHVHENGDGSAARKIRIRKSSESEKDKSGKYCCVHDFSKYVSHINHSVVGITIVYCEFVLQVSDLKNIMTGNPYNIHYQLVLIHCFSSRCGR
jgi:hypothetical protein